MVDSPAHPPARAEQTRGEVFLDARGNGRSMRLSWHPEVDVVVLSLWRGETCAGTFRMPHEDVVAFIDSLVDGLRDAPGVHLPPPRGPVARSGVHPVHPVHPPHTETQVFPAPGREPAFADWAFGPRGVDDRASTG